MPSEAGMGSGGGSSPPMGGLPMPSEAGMGSGGGSSPPMGGLPMPSEAGMGSGGGSSPPAGGLPMPSEAGMGSGGRAPQPGANSGGASSGSSGSGDATMSAPADGASMPTGGSLPWPDGAGGAAGQYTPQAAAPTLPKFRISNGIVAAHNGGKATNFTLEYALSAGVLARDLKTLLMIDPAQGDDIVKPVTLKQDGKLSAFFKDVATDRGPFECYLAVVMGDGTNQAISDKVKMSNSP
jgi:hypothetical protein